MSARNYYVRNPDPSVLATLQAEYESMGRDTKLEGTTLTVFSRKQAKPEKKKVERKRQDRD